MQVMNWPVALTIAGSDSGGGAGIQADLKTFEHHQVFGTSAITAVTAQNLQEVRGVYPITAEGVKAQIEAVRADFPVAAVKIGMLFQEEIIRAVAECLRGWRVFRVLDPVMVASSGGMLLEPGAVQALTSELIPIVELITPNIPEAEVLLGRDIPDEAAAREAVEQLWDRWGGGTAILLKGGHLPADTVGEVTDWFYNGQEVYPLRGKRVWGSEVYPDTPTLNTHGTGCTLSAAIAAQCTRENALTVETIERAKTFVYQALKAGCERDQPGRGLMNHAAAGRHARKESSGTQAG